MSEMGSRPGGLTALAVINFVLGAWGLLAAALSLLSPAIATELVKEIDKAERAETQAVVERESGSESRAGAASRRVATTREREDRATARVTMEKVKSAPFLLFLAAAAVELAISALLVVSGIGYLKIRRFLGRMLGTIYALVALGWSVVEIAYTQKLLGESFGLISMIGFLYPLVTLLMLRVTFKDDFVNP